MHEILTKKKMDKNISKQNTFRAGSASFSPVSLPTSPAAGSPQKNLTGPPRVIRDITADLYNNIQRWNTSHIKSSVLIKKIASIKVEDLMTYTSQLEEYVNELYTIFHSTKENYNFFSVLINQAEAFTRLPNVKNPVFFSLDACDIAQLIRDVSEAYIKEFQVKQFVLENIAHAKNKNEVMFLATCWTHQLNINESCILKLESLLVETGHRPIK